LTFDDDEDDDCLGNCCLRCRCKTFLLFYFKQELLNVYYFVMFFILYWAKKIHCTKPTELIDSLTSFE